MKQQLLNSAGKSVKKAGMMTTSEKVYEPFWKVAKLLLACKGENKMVKNETVIKLINDKKISLLLRNNVFSYNQATNEIGFNQELYNITCNKSYCATVLSRFWRKFFRQIETENLKI